MFNVIRFSRFPLCLFHTVRLSALLSVPVPSYFPCCSLLLLSAYAFFRSMYIHVYPCLNYFSFTLPCSPLPQYHFYLLLSRIFLCSQFPSPLSLPSHPSPLTNRKNSSCTYTSILLLFVSHLSIFLMFFPFTVPPS